MTDHFNRLTPAELERLAYLAEEMCEAGQIIGKILRHGYDSFDPTDPMNRVVGVEGQGIGRTLDVTTNRQLLARELGDVQRGLNMMLAAGDLVEAEIWQVIAKGAPSKYMHHQGAADA